jgi:hypothetical protein
MKMKPAICGLLTMAASVSCFLASAQTLAQSAYTIADLATDWGDTSNPNGPWQYREGTIDLAHFPAWFMGGGQPAWVGGTNTQGNFLPVWFKAARTMNWQGGGADFDTGDIGVHSNDCFNGGALCNLPANVMWTSTATGTVVISGHVWDADKILGRSNAFSVLLNGQTIASGEVIYGVNTRAAPISFSIMENVNAGDQIELDITRSQAAGTFAGVSLTIGLTFAGTPGKADCYGQSVSALAQRYGGLNNAAAALDFSGVGALQNAIASYCGV